MTASDTARIFRHSLRSRILSVLAEHDEASPADVAAALGAPLGHVSYHMKVLHEARWIELVRVERRRGGRRHVYRVKVPPFIDDATWEVLPLALRRGLTNESLRRVFQTAATALRTGGFDDAGAHVDLMSLRLDAQGVAELSGLLTGTLAQAQAIWDRSAARDGADVGQSLLVILHYRLASPTAPNARGRT
jgi:DNA-binding transcriptional ArsR family regulator